MSMDQRQLAAIEAIKTKTQALLPSATILSQAADADGIATFRIQVAQSFTRLAIVIDFSEYTADLPGYVRTTTGDRTCGSKEFGQIPEIDSWFPVFVSTMSDPVQAGNELEVSVCLPGVHEIRAIIQMDNA